uniref:Oxygen-dependent protoporphyrinogen oxidase n=1 Tax=Candidatus Kentrum sp. SD TaxID=2126332 RepID=A0A450YG53_9GAMM|nr:MAG: oxygen-dependent protoporphyrinogen oxidase [Candidatus Kentron sp. SD]VFK40514.1 MAG: oxygen-dependent protoporphyrinogen oxidase [Candidatus Kentron sp. SD]
MSNQNRQLLDVAIVGGGISGLATAFFISQFAPGSRVAIFEKEVRFGGTMRTEHRNGFLFEAGPNGFLSNRIETLDLVRESGAEEILLRSNDHARIRYIFSDELRRLPDTPPAFLRTGLLSLQDKLRVLGEVFVPPKKDHDDENLRAFGYRRLGRAFTDIFLDAMSAGIYASTPDRLSVNAAFPAVVKLEKEYGGLFKGMIKKRKKKAGPSGVLMSFQNGVGAFAKHLANVLVNTPAMELHTDALVTGVARADSGYCIAMEQTESEVDPGFAFKAESVILATPAYVTADLMAPMDQEIATKLRAISYSPIAVVGFGFENLTDPLRGFGLLTTSGAEQEILGVLWDSAIFSGRAPATKQFLRVLIGGQRNPELALRDESALVDIAREGIRKTMRVTDTPSTIFVKRWKRGIPNYPVGHLANVRDIHERIKAYPGLLLNSNAYFGIGINDCVINSLACAKRWIDGRDK